MGELHIDRQAFAKERNRLAKLSRLQQVVAEYARLRAASAAHDDSSANEPLQEIFKLEAELSHEPYVLTELKYDDSSKLGVAAKRIWEEAGPLVSAIQRLSMAGEQESSEYQELTQQLERLGVRFACLFSDENSAAIIVGEEGWVHQQIRLKAMELRDGGVAIPLRPDASGQVIDVNGSLVVRLDDLKPVNTVNLVLGKYGEGVKIPVVDSELTELGEAKIYGPNMREVSARSSTFFTDLEKKTSGKRR